MPDGPLVAKCGNVTKQPVLKFSEKTNKAFVKFGIAVNPYAPKDQPKPEPQFYDVTAFGSLAENIAASINKGYRVVVIGTGKTETWTAKDGTERTSKVILADSVGPDLRFVTAELRRAEQQHPTNGQYAQYSEEKF